MADAGAPPGADGGASAIDATRALRTTLRGIATVVAPASLVTALLFYFGWSRSANQARVMGLDDTLFGFSTRDYLLFSIDAMFWPLFVGAVAVLAALAVHAALVTWAGESPVTDSERRRLLGRGAGLLGGAGIVLLVLGAIGVRRTAGLGIISLRLVSLYSSILVTLGIVALGYGLHLRRRFLRGAPRAANPELDTVRLVSGSVIVLILLLSLFWNVSQYAAVKGVDLAVALENNLLQQPDVTVYSAKRLHIEAPVTETKLPAENSAYLYRYTGLRLLFRSDRTYFLRPADSDPRFAQNILVTESPEIRLEFA